MTVTLATVRTDLYNALSEIDNVNTYRRRQRDYNFPVLVVGWPESMDVRAAMGGQRDFIIDIHIGVEVLDPDGADKDLSDLLEAAVVKIQETSSTWDVRPVTDFGEDLTQDQRVLLWCRLPVAVFE